ncbi:MAG TPA: cellulase family glycosylhydrolase [Bacteroidales bacterium]|nr:cellulase family glycosylhydrolase [Bacteroidales bacterium]
MKFSRVLLLLITVSLLTACSSDKPPVPLSIHPQNPHYFLFRNNPVVLIGSTEHYGAVMNLDFDYVRYLDELAECGLNVTRTFSGIYVEPAGAFGIAKNTMAPDPERYIAPWARSSEAGYSNGGNKFDLSLWDEEYFARLKDFVDQAGTRNIIVELDLFSNFYDTIQWKLSPLNSINNINGIGSIKDHKEILSLRHPDILSEQEKMVNKIIDELKDFDNLYYEVCNEPYFGDTIALREWEVHMTSVVAEAEKDFVNKHLVSNNVQNFKKFVPVPRKHVSIYNFHYAEPPVTVPLNYHLNLPLGDNETGFRGIDDATYRREAWKFLMAGGALFNHLDYSFTVDSEDGSFIVKKGQPGGGSRALREQFKILAGFMRSLNFIEMKPLGGDAVKPDVGGAAINGLVEDGKVWALYLSVKDTVSRSTVLEIELPEGSYGLTWIDTKSGSETTESHNGHNDGWLQVKSPVYLQDIALKIVKR